MQYSAEIRWFTNKPAEEKLTNWFNANGKHFRDQPVRSDIYLLIKDLKTHGIKMREGNLEIKILRHDWGELSLPGQNIGNANLWCKYSFSLKTSDNDTEEVLEAFAGPRTIGLNSDWIRIDKQRLLIKYEIDPDKSSIKKVIEKANPEQGCNVEFTRLGVNLQKEYFTFGFEAFGKGINVRKNLNLAVTEVFSDLKISGLTKEISLTYPEFIASLE